MRILVLLAAVSALPFCASATFISTAPDGAIVTEFDGSGSCSDGPQTMVDAGLTISSDGAACIAWSGFLNFDDNGYWSGLPAVSDYSGFTTITINLEGYFSSVGGLLNYDEVFTDDGLFLGGSDPTITALDANMNVIESADIAFYINGEYIDVNDGRFFGFTESTPDISYFQISGSGLALADLTTASPEPATLGLSAFALAAIILLSRRKFLKPFLRPS